MSKPDRYATRGLRTEFEAEPQVVRLYNSDPPPDYFDVMADVVRAQAKAILDGLPDGPLSDLGDNVDVEA